MPLVSIQHSLVKVGVIIEVGTSSRKRVTNACTDMQTSFMVVAYAASCLNFMYTVDAESISVSVHGPCCNVVCIMCALMISFCRSVVQGLG